MGRHGNLPRNAVLAVLEVVLNGIILFVLYRYLLDLLGAEQVGLWSVVLAVATVSRISEFGFASGATKFVATAHARSDEQQVSEVVLTALTSVAVILGLVLLLLYPAVEWALSAVVPDEAHGQARALIPYAVASVWFGGISAVCRASLDGCHRADLRSLLTMASTVAFLALVFMLAPEHGLIGLGIAQMCQAMILAFSTWCVLRSQVRKLPWIPLGWSRKVFSDMFRYSFNFQLFTALTMLYEPLTKALISKFGGLSATAYFEMASRMIQQFRSLIIAVNKVLVPRIAAQKEVEAGSLTGTYLTIYRWSLFVTLPMYALLSCSTSLIGLLWIGERAEMFTISAFLLTIGFTVNTLGAPAYFMNVGEGDLRWNVWSQALLAFLTAALGFPLGAHFGANGVVLAAVVALIASSVVTMLAYHRRKALSITALAPEGMRGFILGTGIILMIGGLIDLYLEDSSLILLHSLALCASGGILILILTLLSPMRKEIIDLLRRPGAYVNGE